MITTPLLQQAMDYPAYKQLLETLMAEGKTTGPNQSEEYLHYAKINLQRMQRLDKTVVLSQELLDVLSKVSTPCYWVILTEGWCGDAAQNLPVFRYIEQACPAIGLRILLRDEHPEVIDQYLTNGSRSIPKLICLEKDSLKERFVWGPRPAALQEIVTGLIREKKTLEEKGLVVQNWYNTDKTQSLQRELTGLIQHL
jgi:hypothetical protein